MIKIKKIFLNLILISFLHSCGAFSDAGKVLRNEKIKNRDEFSVQKKEPLSMPPEYDTLPRPGSVQKSKNNGNYFLYSVGHSNVAADHEFEWVKASGNGTIYSYLFL